MPFNKRGGGLLAIADLAPSDNQVHNTSVFRSVCVRLPRRDTSHPGLRSENILGHKVPLDIRNPADGLLAVFRANLGRFRLR